MKSSRKIALVTGATKGIGRAIAEALLRDSYSVFVCARNPRELKTAISEMKSLGEISGEVCDMRDEKSVVSLLKSCVKKFGGIDVLVNNAGVGVFGKTVEEISVKEFREIVETNLFGVFYACRAAIPLMKKRGGGCIINISSLAGQNAHPRMAAYNASKFGLNGFSEALMQEVRHDNIKVSVISPGSVNTGFGGDAASAEKSWQIQPEDIAELVVDLLQMNSRTLPSKIEVRPSKPPKNNAR